MKSEELYEDAGGVRKHMPVGGNSPMKIQKVSVH